MAISYPSSAASIPSLTPEQAFTDGSVTSFGMSDNFWTNLGDFFTGYKSGMKSKWDSYLLANERAYEQAKLHDARQWDSMKYQIAAQDLLKAGLNPWLAVQNGLSGAGSNVNASASTGSSSATSLRNSKDKSGQISSFIKDLAATALKVAGLFAIFG